jgi:CheY-like chemotaxis protein
VKQTNVLIVDDAPLNLKLLATLMKAHGFQVRTADSGETALQLLEAARFDVILVDVRMPGIDGLSLVRRLRADPSYARLLIVAVTAAATQADEDAALRSGCDAFVTKPIDTQTFAALVVELLAKRSTD